MQKQQLFIGLTTKNLLTKKINMNYKSIEKGGILSENTFFTVVEKDREHVTCLTEDGQKVSLSRAYVEGLLQSGDIYSKEEKLSMTQLADVFLNNPRVAMTVAYYKKDKNKLVRDYKAEVASAVERVTKATVGTIEKVLLDLIANPISKIIPGELRVMRGRHYRGINELGRVGFIDMEVTEAPTEKHDPRIKQVDPRTIQYVIVNDVKYSLK